MALRGTRQRGWPGSVRRVKRRTGPALPSRMYFLSPVLFLLLLSWLQGTRVEVEDTPLWLRELVRGRKELIRKACHCPKGQRHGPSGPM